MGQVIACCNLILALADLLYLLEVHSEILKKKYP